MLTLEPDAAQALYDNNENNLHWFLFEYGNASILFTGISKGVEYYLAGRMERCICLKVPHHGSNTSALMFSKAVSPRAAVIQCGINSFGHPAEQVYWRGFRSQHYGLQK